MLRLTELRASFREQNIRPNKRLGQNFLVDSNIRNKIIEATQITKEDTVLEIGPGLGALTEKLCERAGKVIAVEKDKKLYEILLKTNACDNLDLIHGDILSRPKPGLPGAWPSWGPDLKIVGNLPYYISSAILIELIENRRHIGEIFITVQKEFAERIVAKPGSRTYGSISCFTQFYAKPEILFTIKKNAFYPVPKVDSCFLKITIRKEPLYLTDEEMLFRLIRGSFGKRRKTILNSLSSSGLFGSKKDISLALNNIKVEPSRRPETMSLDEFVRISGSLNMKGGENGR